MINDLFPSDLMYLLSHGKHTLLQEIYVVLYKMNGFGFITLSLSIIQAPSSQYVSHASVPPHQPHKVGNWKDLIVEISGWNMFCWNSSSTSLVSVTDPFLLDSLSFRKPLLKLWVQNIKCCKLTYLGWNLIPNILLILLW